MDRALLDGVGRSMCVWRPGQPDGRYPDVCSIRRSWSRPAGNRCADLRFAGAWGWHALAPM